jgi:hypothetical protein
VSSSDQPTPAAGWYADPADPTRARYWDGTWWTDHLAAYPQQSTVAVNAGGASRTQDRVAREQDRLARRQHRLARQQERQARRQEQAQEQARRRRAQAAAYGRNIADTYFAGTRVRLYDRGYVSLTLFGTPRYERLISVESSADVTKKTFAGRAVTAAMTGGINLLGPNKRGDVYLLVTTEVTTHTLRASPPTASNMVAAKSLAAAGQALLRTIATVPVDHTPSAAPEERLRVLSQLRDDNLIAIAEFEQAKARLLAELAPETAGDMRAT